MLKLARFDYTDVDAFNAFRIEHPPRNSSKADVGNGGGIIIHQTGGLYVFYEDGEPYTSEEQISWCVEQIRTYKAQLLQAEPMTRIVHAKNKELSDEIAANMAEMESMGSDKVNSKRYKEIEKSNDHLQQIIDGNNNAMLMAENGNENARNQIVAMRAIIEDITSGKLVI